MPLYIRYDASDNAPAVRPVLRNPHHSPAIFFTDPLNPMNTVESPRIGVPVDIRVKVETNQAGAPPPPPPDVTVQVWVCDWTVGPPGPATVPPGGSITAAGLSTATGAGTIHPGPLGSSAVVAVFNWTPGPGDFLNVDPATGNAHMCMGANVFRPPEGSAVTAGSLDIHNNEHHAQKNILILPAIGGKAMLKFAAQNPSRKAAVFFVEIRPVPRLGRPEREMLLAMPFVRIVGGRPFDPKQLLRGGGQLAEPLEHHLIRAGGKLVLGTDKLPVHHAGGRFEQLTLELGKQSGRRLKLKLPPANSDKGPTFVTAQIALGVGREPGAVRAFDVVQVREDGTPIGGGRVVAVNVRAKDLKRRGPQ